jgi:hypothetical protein
MSLKLVTFRARFPEFANLPDATLLDAIDRGAAQSDATIFGDLVDESTGYLAAHFLALSPYGQQARLVGANESTTYYIHWRRLANKKAAGWARVTG